MESFELIVLSGECVKRGVAGCGLWGWGLTTSKWDLVSNIEPFQYDNIKEKVEICKG